MDGMGRRKGWIGGRGGTRKGWDRGKDGKEEGMGRRKGLEGGRDGEVEAMGRWKQWGKEAMMGGGRGGEEGIGRNAKTGDE